MQTIGVIGLGYVGLPTAIGFHDAGFEVWGVDVSQRTVDMILKDVFYEDLAHLKPWSTHKHIFKPVILVFHIYFVVNDICHPVLF